MTVIWDVETCDLLKLTDVSDVLTASALTKYMCDGVPFTFILNGVAFPLFYHTELIPPYQNIKFVRLNDPEINLQRQPQQNKIIIKTEKQNPKTGIKLVNWE
jgi:hypothetical protein